MRAYYTHCKKKNIYKWNTWYILIWNILSLFLKVYSYFSVVETYNRKFIVNMHIMYAIKWNLFLQIMLEITSVIIDFIPCSSHASENYNRAKNLEAAF